MLKHLGIGNPTAKINRDKALKNYYSNPNICLYCKEIIIVKDHQKVADVRKKKFCSHSCSLRFKNNIPLTIKDSGGKRQCTCCLKFKKMSEFFVTKRKDNLLTYHCYCKECQRKKVVKQIREIKQKCVDYKGGKCIKCGYNKCVDSFDFHHKNPKDKDFNISKLTRGKNFSDKLKSELDKCELLCSNCHRETHFTNRQ